MLKQRFEDLKEVAPCGMRIRYTVDNDTDMITYNDINDRGEYNHSEKCKGCSWYGICKPTEVDFMKIITEKLGREIDPLEVITQLFNNQKGAV